MKIRVYCEKCDKEYVLEVGQPWVALMSCPHDIEFHVLREVIEDDISESSTHSRGN